MAADVRRHKRPSRWRRAGLVLGVGILATVLNPFVWRVCCYKPYSQPSGSMEPTLLVGDYWLASTWAYWWSAPERGDVVVFDNPRSPAVQYVKRIVGLPSEVVQMRGGHVLINGRALGYRRIADLVESDRNGNPHSVAQFEEILPDRRSYRILDRAPDSPGDDTEDFQVPAGHYFMLGDNRDNSSDSRFPQTMGMVPASNIRGRAAVIYYSLADTARDGDDVRWSRVLLRVR
ncbi:MAG: signal peptidase I [Hyphomicrobiaceae bacterium]